MAATFGRLSQRIPLALPRPKYVAEPGKSFRFCDAVRISDSRDVLHTPSVLMISSRVVDTLRLVGEGWN